VDMGLLEYLVVEPAHTQALTFEPTLSVIDLAEEQ